MGNAKKQIIISIVLGLALLILGFFIGNKISTHLSDRNADYYKAVKINNDEELFKYCMDTNIGNTLAYGRINAIDPVTHPDIEGNYIFLERVKEKYTMHTRTVTSTDSKGRVHTKTETYWTWDEIETEKTTSSKVNFLGTEFDTSKFLLPRKRHITTVNESSHIRYVYYGVGSEFNTSMFGYLADGTIRGEKVPLYKDKNIQEVIEDLGRKLELIVFWLLWTFIIGISVYGMYSLLE